MKAPIIVDDQGDLSFFRTADSLARYIEAVDVEEGGSSAYDSDGRRLRLRTQPEERSVLFGLFKVRHDRTLVECEDAEPDHAETLRSVLVEFLLAEGIPAERFVGSVSLKEILDLAIEKVGFTR